jgi:hypothetical protein
MIKSNCGRPRGRPGWSQGRGRFPAVLLVAGTVLVSHLSAQDLEPRFLSPAPVGMSFAVLGYGYSIGNVMLDQSLPLDGVTARLHSITAGYARSINLFGRAGQIAAILPTATGTWRGELAGVDTSTTRTGFGDPMVSLSMNLLGAPALSRREYATYRPRTIVGATVRMRAPLGQYNPEKFFNLGSNRWMISPRLGVAQFLGRFTVEGSASAWFFTTNTNFYGGSAVAQAPIVAFQLHTSYTFRPGLWAAVSFGQTFGGSLTIDGIDKDNAQTNNRIAATLAIPVSKSNAVKLVYSSGVSTRAGADFDTIVAAWQYRW